MTSHTSLSERLLAALYAALYYEGAGMGPKPLDRGGRDAWRSAPKDQGLVGTKKEKKADQERMEPASDAVAVTQPAPERSILVEVILPELAIG